MNIWKALGFEMPSAFAKFSARVHPPKVSSTEHRHASDAIASPVLQFYNPDALHFPDHMKPVLPGHGGYVTCGLGMVTYDHQPMWDRHDACVAGPVRKFIRDMVFDNRVKHL